MPPYRLPRLVPQPVDDEPEAIATALVVSEVVSDLVRAVELGYLSLRPIRMAAAKKKKAKSKPAAAAGDAPAAAPAAAQTTVVVAQGAAPAQAPDPVLPPPDGLGPSGEAQGAALALASQLSPMLPSLSPLEPLQSAVEAPAAAAQPTGADPLFQLDRPLVPPPLELPPELQSAEDHEAGLPQMLALPSDSSAGPTGSGAFGDWLVPGALVE
eukprot:7341110-Prymnesium_polylepis.1